MSDHLVAAGVQWNDVALGEIVIDNYEFDLETQEKYDELN